MMYIYLTINANCCEPESLAETVYVHVKCKSDGSQTIIVTPQPIDTADCISLSPESAQSMLDDWIDAENAGIVPDAQGNLMTQSRIDLGSYLN